MLSQQDVSMLKRHNNIVINFVLLFFSIQNDFTHRVCVLYYQIKPLEELYIIDFMTETLEVFVSNFDNRLVTSETYSIVQNFSPRIFYLLSKIKVVFQRCLLKLYLLSRFRIVILLVLLLVYFFMTFCKILKVWNHSLIIRHLVIRSWAFLLKFNIFWRLYNHSLIF